MGPRSGTHPCLDLTRAHRVAPGILVVRTSDGSLVLWALGRDRLARRFELAIGGRPLPQERP